MELYLCAQEWPVPVQLPASQRKRPANLTLAPERLQFGQIYAEAHQISLSGLVESLLGALEQTVALKVDPAVKDPLDGLLAGWPNLDKKGLRAAQHEARLGR
jgi:hypothetical protein